MDSFLQIQLGTVFRGLSRVPDEEVLNLYRNRFIPIAYVEGVKGDVRLSTPDSRLPTVLKETFYFLHRQAQEK